MAYIVGYVTRKEREELERRGWEVEDAKDYNLIGPLSLLSEKYFKEHSLDGDQAVVIFVDSDVFQVMNGPDWEKGPEEGAGHDMDRCNKHHMHNCPDCHPMPEDAEER